MNIAIFGIDPGGHTGVAWGIFDPGKKTFEECVKSRTEFGSRTIEGEWQDQAFTLARAWQNFLTRCVTKLQLPPERVKLVCENFIQKPGMTAGGQDSTIPLLIIGGIEGYRYGQAHEWEKNHPVGQLYCPPMILQMAGEASAFANKDRLRQWDLWIVGKEHERSACKHVALRLAKIKESDKVKARQSD